MLPGMGSALPKRLFDLVEELQGRGLRTSAELARRLGVSERTVRRDIGRLIELDLPVETQPGRNGGVSLPAGALLPAVRFTDDELLALATDLRDAEQQVLGGDVLVTEPPSLLAGTVDHPLGARVERQRAALDPRPPGDCVDAGASEPQRCKLRRRGVENPVSSEVGVSHPSSIARFSI